MTNTLETYDEISQRVLDDDGNIVGMILQMANDQWGVFDRDEKLITRETADTPEEALEIFEKVLVDHTENALKNAYVYKKEFQKTKPVKYFGLELWVPEEAVQIATDANGEIHAFTVSTELTLYQHCWTRADGDRCAPYEKIMVCVVSVPKTFDIKNSLVKV